MTFAQDLGYEVKLTARSDLFGRRFCCRYSREVSAVNGNETTVKYLAGQ